MRCVQRRACPRPLHLNLSQRPDSANQLPRFFYGWYIVLCCFISQGVRAGLGNQTFGFFIKPLTEELGWSRAVLTGALIWGYLADRVEIRLLLVLVLMGSAAALSALFFVNSPLMLYLGFALPYGLTAGSLTVLGPLIWARYFGRRHLGSIQGLMGPIGLVPGLLGPMFAAFVYDATGSYEFAFGCFVCLFAIGALMMWWVRRPVASP